MTGVKICGLSRPSDALEADALGANYLGVILAPGGRRSLSSSVAARVLEGTAARRVGVFVDAPRSELRRTASEVGLDVLQLHGAEAPDLLRSLREVGGWELWKVLRPRSASEFVAGVEAYGEVVDAILVDGYSPEASGGVGARFPWEEVAKHRALIPEGVRLVVAGGLRPDNVARAIRLLQPDVVDVSSGVEDAPGCKSSEALHGFFASVHAPSPV